MINHNNMLEKDNQLMLKKLVEISMGKRSTLPTQGNSSKGKRKSIYPVLKKELSLENIVEEITRE